jgi:hypothetical protein
MAVGWFLDGFGLMMVGVGGIFRSGSLVNCLVLGAFLEAAALGELLVSGIGDVLGLGEG